MLIDYIIHIKGKCSAWWRGFDGCPVALASEIEHYCRTVVTVNMSIKVKNFILQFIHVRIYSLSLGSST